jgi:hypothetical protein
MKSIQNLPRFELEIPLTMVDGTNFIHLRFSGPTSSINNFYQPSEFPSLSSLLSNITEGKFRKISGNSVSMPETLKARVHDDVSVKRCCLLRLPNEVMVNIVVMTTSDEEEFLELDPGLPYIALACRRFYDIHRSMHRRSIRVPAEGHATEDTCYKFFAKEMRCFRALLTHLYRLMEMYRFESDWSSRSSHDWQCGSSPPRPLNILLSLIIKIPFLRILKIKDINDDDWKYIQRIFAPGTPTAAPFLSRRREFSFRMLYYSALY